MNSTIDLKLAKKAAISVREALPDANPTCAIVLGSGWGDLSQDFEILREIEYYRIPGLGNTGVLGHAGKLALARLNEVEVLLFKGRRHWYEGDGWTPVILPAFIAKQMGCTHLLLTNASGGINENCPPGTLVAISDHINMLGANPLQGPHHPELGCRFPDMSEIYRIKLREKLIKAGATREGVYLAASGPSFETPAEIRAFSAWGADLVGMSTAPEAIVGNALGLQVAGLSCVCNWAAGISKQPLTGEDVVETANQAMPQMRAVIGSFIRDLAND
jgi:purine-nucleoside phosphorylase